jgi:hypothetical protein
MMLYQTKRIVTLLLSLQVTCIVFMWTLDALNQISEAIFALFLAVNLISFAMMSYIYRVNKLDEVPRRIWIIIGCFLVLALIFSSLFLR